VKYLFHPVLPSKKNQRIEANKRRGRRRRRNFYIGNYSWFPLIYFYLFVRRVPDERKSKERGGVHKWIIRWLFVVNEFNM